MKPDPNSPWTEERRTLQLDLLREQVEFAKKSAEEARERARWQNTEAERLEIIAIQQRAILRKAEAIASRFPNAK